MLKKYQRLSSTKTWVQNIMRMSQNHENLLERFEQKISKRQSRESVHEQDETEQYIDEEPVNLLIIDGGGMRGYATLPIFSAIEEMYFKGQAGDFIDHFDMLGGTSVGGIVSLLFSHYKGMGSTTEDMISIGRDLIDDLREKVFGNISLLNLCRCRHEMIDKNYQIINVLRTDFNVPLRSDSIPTMALIASSNQHIVDEQSVDDDIQITENHKFEPFIARTYDYAEDKEYFYGEARLAKSSNDMMLYEACAATSAVPLLLDRVRITVDDQPRVFADGMMFQNCPMALCLDEASSLYPNRPIGVILSIGFTNDEEPFLNRTVEAVRRLNPNVHYQRIVPSHITEKFSPAETDLEKIAKMEVAISDWIRTDQKVLSAMNATMQKLLCSKPRAFGNSDIPQMGLKKSFGQYFSPKKLSSMRFFDSYRPRTSVRKRIRQLYRKKS